MEWCTCGGQLPRNPEHRAALEVLLLMAEADAGWGRYASAVGLLDRVGGILGELPEDYELKRERWNRLRTAA